MFLQGFSETALSFAAHGGMNVTGLSIVDINNKTTKAFARAWKGLDSTKWTDSGHRQITASRPASGSSAIRLKSYSIIESGTGFTVNLGSDSPGKSNDLGVSSVSRIHFGFGFIVNPDPDPIIG